MVDSTQKVLNELVNEVLKRNGEITLRKHKGDDLVSVDVTVEGKIHYADLTDLRAALLAIKGEMEQ